MILDSILFVCKQIIETEINNSEFLVVMMNETTDVSDKSQVVLVFHYIKNSKAVVRFWKFFNSADLTAATLSAVVINELELLIGSFSEKLVAQTYDGAAVLRGVNSGVQTRVKEVYGNAHLLHCYAHKLNLVMQKAAGHHKQARFFLTIYQEFQLFFLNHRSVQKYWKMQLKDVKFLGLRQPDGTSSLDR